MFQPNRKLYRKLKPITNPVAIKRIKIISCAQLHYTAHFIGVTRKLKTQRNNKHWTWVRVSTGLSTDPSDYHLRRRRLLRLRWCSAPALFREYKISVNSTDSLSYSTGFVGRSWSTTGFLANILYVWLLRRETSFFLITVTAPQRLYICFFALIKQNRKNKVVFLFPLGFSLLANIVFTGL